MHTIRAVKTQERWIESHLNEPILAYPERWQDCRGRRARRRPDDHSHPRNENTYTWPHVETLRCGCPGCAKYLPLGDLTHTYNRAGPPNCRKTITTARLRRPVQASRTRLFSRADAGSRVPAFEDPHVGRQM